MALKHFYLIVVAATLACAPAPGSSVPGAAGPRRSTVLPSEEIVASNLETGTAYEAIGRLRPTWLTYKTESYDPPRTEFPRVFVDGRLYGELESLRNFDATRISEIRFYSPAESGKFGMQAGLSGVIEISTKK
jgi:hypothetical protein